MARLNEPPIPPGPSAETIETVKRRFLRQNRELAKTNSQQSIRIRSLENDASRLLAENLSLREQVLHLQNILDSQPSRPSFENIDAVKNRLEAKIAELGGMVAELGQLQKPNTAPKCKSQATATKKSPDERQWRSGLGLQDVQNAMMPTIVEDKYFPRKTMNADELEEVLEDPNSQSPDIGPPPVSRFDKEGPISYEPNPTEVQPEESVDEFANLETRKKRRESGPKLDLQRISVFQSPPQPERPEEEPTKSVRDGTTVRVGAKRKFSVQDDAEKAESQVEPFRFSRRNTASSVDEEKVAKQERPHSPERLILGSKPVNTDPIVSPKKQRSSTLDKPEKKTSTTNRTSNGRLKITRRPMQDVPPLRIPSEPEQPAIAEVEINLDSLPPKTPAADDIFSPPSTEPSTQRPDNKDTPPPGDLGSGQAGLGARPSRRVRAQVSYKEPALNVKMRRPGKELVDAVTLPNEKRVSFQSETEQPAGTWNPIPPTAGHRAGEELGSPLREKLDRREGSGQGLDLAPPIEQPRLNSSAASHAISALIQASTQRRKSQLLQPPAESQPEMEPEKSRPAVTKIEDVIEAEAQAAKEEKEKEKEKDNLAVFAFPDSSPTDVSKPQTSLPKTSRRYSAMPTVSTSRAPTPTEGEPKPKARSGTNTSTLHSRVGSGSATVSGKSASSSHLSKPTLASVRGSSKEKKTGSVVDLKAAAEDGVTGTEEATGRGAATGNLRAERAALRRKSMML